jgi:membrane protease YdiL (CAAX protease family)
VTRASTSRVPSVPRLPDPARGSVRRFGWRWRGWTRWPITTTTLVVAGLTVLVDVTSAWAGASLGAIGHVPVSPALPVGLVLVACLGARRLGLDRPNLWAWCEFLVLGSCALVVAGASWSSVADRSGDAAGLVLAALGEELVYRVAVVIVVGALVARVLGRHWRNASEWGVAPGVVALLVSSAVFSVLPGHVAQMSDAFHALPFASFGLVMGYAVLRTGAIMPAAIVHALMNLATVAAVSGEASLAGRNLLSAVALAALVIGTVLAGLRLGILRRVPVVVALTGSAARA